MADAALAAISLAVGAIPESLPSIVTISLALGAARMAQRNAVVRLLPAIESLGSTTVICTDKTGTLTQNQMTVKEVLIDRDVYRFQGLGYTPVGSVQKNGLPLATPPLELQRLFTSAVLCNDAILVEESGRWQIRGDPTEGALLVAAVKTGLSLNQVRHAYGRIETIPFDTKAHWMGSIHKTPDKGYLVCIKGAPETIAAKCRVPLDEPAAARLAQRGLRLLAFAEARCDHVPVGTSLDSLSFSFLGMAGMIDPPRAEAQRSIEICKQAGIQVKMITGDHPVTALAIGEELGLGNALRAVEGKELEAMSQAQLQAAVESHPIFARVAPEQKLRLVEALQARGHVVTMTGDGVNDAPALKQAEVGVAMGISGTSVAKEAADLVLLDDRFSSIEAAVEEGRRVYDNILKSLVFILPTNFALAFILLCSIGLFPVVEGIHLLPVIPSQILWVNLVSAVGLGLPLAFENIEPDAMRRPPRPRQEPILSRFLLLRTAFVSILNTGAVLILFLWQYFAERNADSSTETALRTAQSVAVTTIVLFQAFYLLNCRSLHRAFWKMGLFSNPHIYGGIAFVLLAQALLLYTPWLNDLFHTAPLKAPIVLKSALAAFLVMPLIALEKYLYQRMPTK
jgi:Ca2+-transporting ATPase